MNAESYELLNLKSAAKPSSIVRLHPYESPACRPCICMSFFLTQVFLFFFKQLLLNLRGYDSGGEGISKVRLLLRPVTMCAKRAYEVHSLVDYSVNKERLNGHLQWICLLGSDKRLHAFLVAKLLRTERERLEGHTSFFFISA